MPDPGPFLSPVTVSATREIPIELEVAPEVAFAPDERGETGA